MKHDGLLNDNKDIMTMENLGFVGGRNYALGTSDALKTVSLSLYSGNLTTSGVTNNHIYDLSQIPLLKHGDWITVSMYVKDELGSGLRIDSKIFDKYNGNITKDGFSKSSFQYDSNDPKINLYASNPQNVLRNIEAGFLKIEKGKIRTDWTPTIQEMGYSG